MFVRVSDRLRIARRDFTLGGGEAPAPATGAAPAAPSAPDSAVAELTVAGGATLGGMVTDSSGRGLQDARVRVAAAGRSVRTDARGRYSIPSLPAGPYRVSVEAVGYLPASMSADLYGGDSVALNVRLSSVAPQLPTVTVEARRRRAAALSDIDSRRRSGIGSYVDSIRLKDMPGLWRAFDQNLVSVVMKSPNDWTIHIYKPSLAAGSASGSSVAAYCAPAITIDGMKSDMETLRTIAKDEVALIEVYAHSGSGPMQYMTNACGAVVVWTKGFVTLP
jgi:hypothetical protein